MKPELPDPPNQAAATGEAEREPLFCLVTRAAMEMEITRTRYDDRDIALSLAEFDAAGVLPNRMRGFAARVIAEIAARLNDYSSAAGMLNAIRAYALMAATNQPKQEPNK